MQKIKVKKIITEKIFVTKTSGWCEFQRMYTPNPEMDQSKAKWENFITTFYFERSNYIIQPFPYRKEEQPIILSNTNWLDKCWP